MKWVEKVFGWFRIGYGIVIVISIFYIGLFMLSSAYTAPDLERQGGWDYVVVIVALMMGPWILNSLDDEGLQVQWRIRLQNWMRNSVLVLLVIAGALWYLFPDRPHLEPLTFLLGIATAHMTWQVESNRRRVADEVSAAPAATEER